MIFGSAKEFVQGKEIICQKNNHCQRFCHRITYLDPIYIWILSKVACNGLKSLRKWLTEYLTDLHKVSWVRPSHCLSIKCVFFNLTGLPLNLHQSIQNSKVSSASFFALLANGFQSVFTQAILHVTVVV